MNQPTPAPITPDAADARLRRRLVVWSLMVAAIAWTLVYQRAQQASAVPEFVYANF